MDKMKPVLLEEGGFENLVRRMSEFIQMFRFSRLRFKHGSQWLWITLSFKSAKLVIEPLKGEFTPVVGEKCGTDKVDDSIFQIILGSEDYQEPEPKIRKKRNQKLANFFEAFK